MNNQAVVYMNTRRPQSRKSVYSPARSNRRRESLLTAALDGFCYLALMVCLVIGITVLIALV